MLISNCCGAALTEDNIYRLCPKCHEHCEFVDEDELEDDGSLDLPKENEL